MLFEPKMKSCDELPSSIEIEDVPQNEAQTPEEPHRKKLRQEDKRTAQPLMK